MKKLNLLVIGGGVIILLDQVTKYLVNSKMVLYESREIVKNFFSLTYLLNPGGAFGILAEQSSSFRFYFFTVFSIIALCVFLFIYIKADESDILLHVSLVMIIGGAVGNIIDRVRLGEVIDFLDFYFKDFHWPPFNIADSAISVGMVLFVLHSFKCESQQRNIAD